MKLARLWGWSVVLSSVLLGSLAWSQQQTIEELERRLNEKIAAKAKKEAAQRQGRKKSERPQSEAREQASPRPTASPTTGGNYRSGQTIKDCDVCPELVVIPAGTFTMGSSAAEQAQAKAAGALSKYTDWENPQHGVRVQSFAAGKYAVTRGEFSAFVRTTGYQTEAEKGDGCFVAKDNAWKKDGSANWRNAGFRQTDAHPVVCVSWNDAQAYAQWISRSSGQPYRLPSEAEREYMTRAGSQSAFWWGDSISTTQANYDGNYSYNGSPKGEYRGGTVPVHSFEANPWGLYNVHGNVWEWVEDWFHESYDGAPTDGSAWLSGGEQKYRVLRGGSWYNDPWYLRSAGRNQYAADFSNVNTGFRLARTLFTP